MKLVSLIYVSRMVNKPSIQDLMQLSDAAEIKNKKLNITGALTYNGGHVMQLLEGDYPEVNRLFQTIATDSRHKDVTLICYKANSIRHFPNWGMRYLQLQADEISQKIKALGRTSPFAPFPMEEDAALEILTRQCHAATGTKSTA